MKDKRKSKRFFEKNKAVINFSIKENDINQNTNLGATWDISVDGVRLFTNKFFSVGTELIISLDLERTDSIVKIWAKVKWVKELTNNVAKYEMGLEFIHSKETLPILFNHLYGQGTIDFDLRKNNKRRSLPVDVQENS